MSSTHQSPLRGILGVHGMIMNVCTDQGEANSAVSQTPEPPKWSGTQSFWCFNCLLGKVNCTATVKAQCRTAQNPVADGRTYLCSFPAMIEAWRQLWKQNTGTTAALPFGWVQLNSYGQPDGPRGKSPHSPPASLRNGTKDPVGAWAPGFPSIRWAQTQSLQLVPDSFQAVVLDTPSPSGAIHSCFKQPVGARLARGALAVAYSRKELHISPGLGGAKQVGKKLTITLTNTGGGTLIVRASLGFEVLIGETQPMWHSAPIVHCDGKHTLTLSLPDVTVEDDGVVMALRYLWSNTPCGGGTLGCPVYVSVPKLGSLTGENDTLPLGPTIVAM